MIEIRRAEQRGRADHGWLDSRHTFSFADYYDPQHVEFGPLRVINEDRVQAGAGFGTHAHRDMEIISYVLEGALEHKDNIGNGSIIKPGDVQRMSAGPGVVHSEYNASKVSPVHFLQIWILPRRAGLPSGYEQKYFSDDEKRGRLRLCVSPDGADGSVRIQQDLRMLATLVGGGSSVRHVFGGRKGWLHVARGAAVANGLDLEAGDGAAIDGEETIAISSKDTAEVLLFDFTA